MKRLKDESTVKINTTMGNSKHYLYTLDDLVSLVEAERDKFLYPVPVPIQFWDDKVRVDTEEEGESSDELPKKKWFLHEAAALTGTYIIFNNEAISKNVLDDLHSRFRRFNVRYVKSGGKVYDANDILRFLRNFSTTTRYDGTHIFTGDLFNTFYFMKLVNSFRGR